MSVLFPLWALACSAEVFNQPELPLLSMSAAHGLRQRSAKGGRAASEDLSDYRVVAPGWLVVNKLSARDGALAVSSLHGIVSPAYWVLRLDAARVVSTFLGHLLKSAPILAELRRRSKSMPPAQFDLPWEQFRALELQLPSLEEQRRVSAFLDQQVIYLDAAIAAVLHVEVVALERSSAVMQERLVQADGDWRVPAGWVVAPVGAFFQLALGKMLNEQRASGVRLRPYLRNINVQWDRIETDDLKEMEFGVSDRRRYGLLRGDLLICEGGQPGRAAVWDGRADEIYFQKALHRARPRTSETTLRWLLHLLRVCVGRNLFSDEGGGGTTIAHLTGEQLRALRLPFPTRLEQMSLVAAFDLELHAANSLQAHARELAARLEERKRALITACVSGEFDVSTASGRAAEAVLRG